MEADPTLDVVGEASSAEEAVALAAEFEPHVVVMDVRMSGRSGVEACRDIRAAREQTKVLMLTSFTDDEALFTAILAGASGYLPKNIRGGDFVGDIHKVANGQWLLDPAVTERVLARLRGDVGPTACETGDDLTSQERGGRPMAVRAPSGQLKRFSGVLGILVAGIGAVVAATAFLTWGRAAARPMLAVAATWTVGCWSTTAVGCFSLRRSAPDVSAAR